MPIKSAGDYNFRGAEEDNRADLPVKEELAVGELGDKADAKKSDLPYQAVGLRSAGPEADITAAKDRELNELVSAPKKAPERDVANAPAPVTSSAPIDDADEEEVRMESLMAAPSVIYSYYDNPEGRSDLSRSRESSITQNKVRVFEDRQQIVNNAVRHVFQARKQSNWYYFSGRGEKSPKICKSQEVVLVSIGNTGIDYPE